MNQFIKPLRELVAGEDGCVSNLAVVIVTWRDHFYTTACLHSLLASSHRPRWIVVVDNGSGDQTSQYIHEFLACRNKVDIRDPFSGLVDKVNIQNHAAHINYILSADISSSIGPSFSPSKTLVRLVTASTNGGFASGNNIGIKYLEKVGHQGCIWMLNNDAYVAPDCIEKLVLNSKQLPFQDVFGTVLVEYNEPQKIQALGGNILKPWLNTRHNSAGSILSNLPTQRKFISADYPVGASMLTWSDSLYGKKQPLYEGYFLYYEEADLCAELGVTCCLIYENAVVAHMGGVATGDSKQKRKRIKHSFARDYYGTRSRLIYCRRHHFKYILYVSLFCIAIVCKRLINLDGRSALAVARGLFSALFSRLK